MAILSVFFSILDHSVFQSSSSSFLRPFPLAFQLASSLLLLSHFLLSPYASDKSHLFRLSFFPASSPAPHLLILLLLLLLLLISCSSFAFSFSSFLSGFPPFFQVHFFILFFLFALFCISISSFLFHMFSISRFIRIFL